MKGLSEKLKCISLLHAFNFFEQNRNVNNDGVKRMYSHDSRLYAAAFNPETFGSADGK